TATANSGCSFSAWTVNGASCANGASSSPCTFTMPAANVTVTATFVAASGPACGSTASSPAIIQPAPGSTIGGTSATLCWTTAPGVTSYQLMLGRWAGDGFYYRSGPQSGSTTSLTVNNLPAAGTTFHVTFYFVMNGALQSVDYTYTTGP